VKFPITDIASKLPEEICEIEEQIKLLNWKRERLLEDMKREETLLERDKNLFNDKKQEMMDFVSQWTSTQVTFMHCNSNN
jgi:hypothetical protein